MIERGREVVVGHKWSQTSGAKQEFKDREGIQATGNYKELRSERHKSSIAVSFLPIALTDKTKLVCCLCSSRLKPNCLSGVVAHVAYLLSGNPPRQNLKSIYGLQAEVYSC